MKDWILKQGSAESEGRIEHVEEFAGDSVAFESSCIDGTVSDEAEVELRIGPDIVVEESVGSWKKQRGSHGCCRDRLLVVSLLICQQRLNFCHAKLRGFVIGTE